MAYVKQYLVLLLAILSFVYTLYVVTHLIQFLSAPRKTSKIFVWVFNLLDNKSRLETAYGPLVFNTLYLILFIFQHSFMKSSIVKKAVQKLGMSSAERSIYSLTSSLCLHVRKKTKICILNSLICMCVCVITLFLQYLINNWVTASSIILWQVDVDANKWMWWTFVLLHAFAWMIICGGSMIMDLPEIVGIKQVPSYHSMN